MNLRQWRRYLLDRGIVYIYAIFVGGYFLMPTASGHRRVFYILVAPAIALLWKELRSFYRGNALFHVMCAYTAYTLLSLLWMTNLQVSEIIDALWQALAVVPFCLLTGYVWIQYPQRMDVLAHRAVWLAAALAGISIIAWYGVNSFPESRLEPLGVMHHPNKAACAYGVFFLFSAYYFSGQRGHDNRSLYLALAAVLLTLIVLTQSRTALAAISVGLLTLVGWKALGAIAIGLAASWVLVAANPEAWWHRVSEFSFRPGIWEQQLANMDGHWLSGYGFRSDTTVAAYGKVFSHAHNGYIASLRDGGLLGLALMLFILVVALLWSVRLLRSRGERIYLALVLYAMTCIAMDFDRILTAPRELWLFFWLPVALTMAAYPNRHDPGLLRYRSQTS